MVKQQLKVTRMWSCLGKQAKDFLHGATTFLPTLEEADLKPYEDELIDTPAEESVEPEEPVDGSLDEDIYYKEEDDDEDNEEFPSNIPESIVLPLPLNVVSFKLGPSFEPLISTEREL